MEAKGVQQDYAIGIYDIVNFDIEPVTALADLGTHYAGDALWAMCGTPQKDAKDIDSVPLSVDCNMCLGVIDAFQETL